MSAVRSVVLPTRWIGADALDELPCFSIFLEGVRLGDARLALSTWDANAIRTVYLGSIETSLGTLGVMIETPPQGEEPARIARENAVATMALDATCLVFDGGVSAQSDPETGHWSVFDGEEQKAAGASKEDAIAIAHAISVGTKS